METIPVTTIPTVTIQVPSTSASPVSTTVAVVTSISTSTTTSTTDSTTATSHPSDEAGKLIKDMQDMSIQTNEINRLKDQIKALEDEKKLVQVMHKNETQKSNRLTHKVQKLQKDLMLKEPLTQAK